MTSVSFLSQQYILKAFLCLWKGGNENTVPDMCEDLHKYLFPSERNFELQEQEEVGPLSQAPEEKKAGVFH